MENLEILDNNGLDFKHTRLFFVADIIFDIQSNEWHPCKNKTTQNK